jgi:hypothetical protein
LRRGRATFGSSGIGRGSADQRLARAPKKPAGEGEPTPGAAWEGEEPGCGPSGIQHSTNTAQHAGREGSYSRLACAGGRTPGIAIDARIVLFTNADARRRRAPSPCRAVGTRPGPWRGAGGLPSDPMIR